MSLLGTRIDRMRLPDLLRTVVSLARKKARATVLYVNVHCMNAAARDPAYRSALAAADVVYCDGTGVRVAARLAGLNIPARMTGADWIDPLCQVAAREGLKLFLMGGEAGVVERAAAVLSARHPGLAIAGTAPGYDLDPSLPALINRSRADVVLVGMGTPRQEKWIAAHRSEIDAPVVWAVGALFDFVTGKIPRGPRWMTEHGLEWLCRLGAEPRKLWRRYLLGNPRFFWRVVRTYYLTRRQ